MVIIILKQFFILSGLCDALEFVISDQSDNKDILTVTGINIGNPPEDNIVMKAVTKLQGAK